MIIKGFSTDAGASSFANLWSHGGMFPNGMNGFILSFQMVVFAFVGIELVGLTAGETENPEKVIPKAINNIPIRIIIFYIGALDCHYEYLSMELRSTQRKAHSFKFLWQLVLLQLLVSSILSS